jgi:hypothetical protein
MIAESRRAVASGEVNTSCPINIVAACHSISAATISNTVSVSADQPRGPSRLTAETA